MNKEPDFIAELQYLTTEQGGRTKPAYSGYRPHIKFDFNKMLTSGQQTFLNKEIVYPGDTVIAEISILATDFFKEKLKVNFNFEFREGPNLIGKGIILEI